MGIFENSGEELRETLQALATTAPSLKHVGYTLKRWHVIDSVAILVRGEDGTLVRWDTVALDRWKGR